MLSANWRVVEYPTQARHRRTKQTTLASLNVAPNAKFMEESYSHFIRYIDDIASDQTLVFA